MCRSIPVPQRVASWKQSSLEPKINTVERVWLIQSATVHNIATDKVLHATHANRRCKGLNLSECMRILPETLLSEGTEIVKSTILVKVVLEEELGWLLNLCAECIASSIHSLGKLIWMSLWGSSSIAFACRTKRVVLVLLGRSCKLERLRHWCDLTRLQCLSEHWILNLSLVRESTQSHSFII